MTLYSYCIPVDDGAAPNPFWGVCTLAICKPVIRRTAQIGDWIVGTGSKKFGFENKVVYAMEVTDKKTIKEYDQYCRNHLPEKIPDITNNNFNRRVGDCVYDYSKSNDPLLRQSVHTEDNRSRDLGGKNVLLSSNFYYFGSTPIPLPINLLKIVNQGQGHKVRYNDPYKEAFVAWILSFDQSNLNTNLNPINLKDICDTGGYLRCSKMHKAIDDEDEEIDSCK